MKKLFVVLVILVLSLTPDLITRVCAQPPPPPGGTTGAPCWPPPCVPIDGGIVFLIAAGVGLGLVKAVGSRRRVL